jgi:hypothetical protein
MTVFEVEELYVYWQKHPPIHLMLAGFFGIADTAPRALPPGVPGEAFPDSRLLGGIPGMTVATVSDMPTPIFDVAELMRQRPN